LLSSIFGWALSAGLWDANPAKGIRRNAERSRDRFLQADELPRFYAALAEEPNETIRDYFLMSLLTGARRANVLAMKWVEVDFKRAEWRIPRTKNDDPHTIPLMPEALAILVQRQSDSESVHVFPGPGKSGHLIEPKGGWRRIFDRDELTQLTTLVHVAGSRFAIAEGENLGESLKRARREAKRLRVDGSRARIKDVRIHDLPRTLGSWQARTGASLSIIGKSLSHKSVQTTAIYSRLDIDPVRESMERATSAMRIAAGGEEGRHRFQAETQGPEAPSMNTVARAWQAALAALEEARDLHERKGDAETVRDLLRHAREMIDVIEAELAEGRAKALDPDVVRMAAAELRKRVDAAAATILLLH
jgi:integrase